MGVICGRGQSLRIVEVGGIIFFFRIYTSVLLVFVYEIALEA